MTPETELRIIRQLTIQSGQIRLHRELIAGLLGCMASPEAYLHRTRLIDAIYEHGLRFVDDVSKQQASDHDAGPTEEAMREEIEAIATEARQLA